MVRKRRHLIQALGALALNGNLRGFLEGRIYTGPSKNICVPALNCYSCPGALGSCPIGSLQAVGGSPGFKLSHYVLGLMIVFGMLGGRVFCGYLCPFGFFQDLMKKIKKINLKFPRIFRILSYLKYIILILTITLPIFLKNEIGMADPYFCKYICPSGTLFAGLPLISKNPLLRETLGALFTWKLSIAIIIVVASIFIYRPFCRFICPLGAFLGLFNKIGFYNFEISDKCISCGACEKACGFDIYTKETPNSPECIRCDECIEACPVNAIEKKYKI